MSNFTNVTLLDNLSSHYTFTGEAVRADSWWGYTDGLHTVQLKVHNFKGSFSLEATLSLTPGEDDWFKIDVSDGLNNLKIADFDFFTGSKAYTFIGNFTYLRGVLIRPVLPTSPTQSEIQSLGHIDKALLSM
jgi:hypothetical protein